MRRWIVGGIVGVLSIMWLTSCLNSTTVTAPAPPMPVVTSTPEPTSEPVRPATSVAHEVGVQAKDLLEALLQAGRDFHDGFTTGS